MRLNCSLKLCLESPTPGVTFATRNPQCARGLDMRCSNKPERSTRMRAHPAQHCSTRSPNHVRMCFALMVGSSTGSRLDRTSGYCVVASVARLVTIHRISRDFESLGEGYYHSSASPYATQRRKQKGALIDKTQRPSQTPEETEG